MARPNREPRAALAELVDNPFEFELEFETRVLLQCFHVTFAAEIRLRPVLECSAKNRRSLVAMRFERRLG